MCAVLYPAALKCSAIVICSPGIPGFPFWDVVLPGTPACIGYRPVKSPAREGEQTGAAE